MNHISPISIAKPFTRFLIISLFLIIGCTAAGAQSRQEQADSIHATLKKGMTPQDSIGILYDVFDLSDADHRSRIGWELLGVAERSGDVEVIYDMIPQLSVIDLRKRENLDRLLELSRQLPDCPHGKAVETYVLVSIATYEGTYLSPEERSGRLVEYLKEDMTAKDDVYQNFLDLYRVVVFLGYTHEGNMYMEYLDRLEKMIEDLPEVGFGFPSRFYTAAANFYTRNDYPEKAIEADRQLLKLMDEMEKYYAEKGRKYRNYDRYRYLCYRRMLSNYEALSPAEVEELYRKCEAMAKDNPEIHHDFYNNLYPDSYYLMAKGRFSEAIPALEKTLSVTASRHLKFKILRRLAIAADTTGNQAVLVHALKDYSTMLEQKLQANAQGALMELQTRNEVRRLEEEKQKAEHEKFEAERDSDQKLISVSLISLFVLAIILMFLYRSHFKLIHRSRDQKEEIDKLHSRVEELLYDGVPAGSEELPLRKDCLEGETSKGKESPKKEGDPGKEGDSDKEEK